MKSTFGGIARPMVRSATSGVADRRSCCSPRRVERRGEQRTTPLIYEEAGDRLVIVASKGGSPEDPGWYRNLVKDPQVELQVKGDVFPAHARTATGDEREELWELAARQWPDYDAYQQKTDREIPVVVLERD